MKRYHTGRAFALALLVSLAASPALAQSAPFVWVDQLPDPGPSPAYEYTIGVGDLLTVQVWDQEKMSAKTRVRNDGRISLPILNDVDAAGKQPVRLATEIEVKLKSVIVNPRVTVLVEESKPLSVSVLGEVLKPGMQSLDVGAGVAQALASAGGLTMFAHKDQVYVLRSGGAGDPKATRIRFKYESLIRAIGRAPLFRLRSGDIVVVE